MADGSVLRKSFPARGRRRPDEKQFRPGPPHRLEAARLCARLRPLPRRDVNRGRWRRRPESRYRRSLSRFGKTFAGGKIARAAHCAGEPHEFLCSFVGATHALELFAHNLSLGHSSAGSFFLQPSRHGPWNTNSDCSTPVSYTHLTMPTNR